MYQSSYKREQLSGFVFNMQVSIFNWKPVLPDFTMSASSETQGLWVNFKSGRKSPWGHCLTLSSISLTLCAETETFHLEQSFVARPKQTRRATELLVHLRVKTHERTLKHTSLWSGRKTQRFSGTNQIQERLRPFGTSLVRQCPQGLFRPDLKSTHSPWVSEDAMSVKSRSVHSLRERLLAAGKMPQRIEIPLEQNRTFNGQKSGQKGLARR